MRLFKKSIVLTALFALPIPGMAQQAKTRIAYVQVQRVLSEYEEFKELESQLELELRKAQFEFQGMTNQLDSLREVFETQRLMSSPEWRRQKEQEIADLQQRVQAFQLGKIGPEGELTKKQQQAEAAIFQKFQSIVKKVAEEKGYDLIFDAASLLYAEPVFDITEDVLYELRRSSPGSLGD